MKLLTLLQYLVALFIFFELFLLLSTYLYQVLSFTQWLIIKGDLFTSNPRGIFLRFGYVSILERFCHERNNVECAFRSMMDEHASRAKTSPSLRIMNGLSSSLCCNELNLAWAKRLWASSIRAYLWVTYVFEDELTDRNSLQVSYSNAHTWRTNAHKTWTIIRLFVNILTLFRFKFTPFSLRFSSSGSNYSWIFSSNSLIASFQRLL